jgi:NDP-sugar pyrophosphorylase family protein
MMRCVVSSVAAVILCAGRGERLRPLTLSTPKCLAEIRGVPLLGRTMEWLRGYGVSDACINLHHLPDEIRGYLGDGSAFGVAVEYSFEPVLLGSAGALWPFESHLPDEFYVVYGDVFTNAALGRLLDAHQGTQADLTMLVSHVDNPTECGLVDFDDNGCVRRIVEKPLPADVFTEWANGGVYVVAKRVFDLIPHGTTCDFGGDVLPALLRDNRRVTAVPLAVGEYLVDIGSPEKLEYAQGVG